MSTIARNTTLRISHHGGDHYELLDQRRRDRNYIGRGTPSKGRKEIQGKTNPLSWTYRRERAKQRQIFLKTYKLKFINSSRKFTGVHRVAKKLVVKVNKMVLSILSFTRRNASLRCRNRGSALRVVSPLAVMRNCC